MVAPLDSSLVASAYPKGRHLTKSGADTLYAALPTVGASYMNVLRAAGVPLDGVTGVGILNTGEVYIDTNTGNAYINQGTLLIPAYHGFIIA